MTQDLFSWLHLTDLHYGLHGLDSLWPSLRQPFLDDLEALHTRCGPWHAVLFTGDLAQSGGSEQYRSLQQEVLDRIWEKLRALGSGDAALLAVPGNHDLVRPRMDGLGVDRAALKWILRHGIDDIEDDVYADPDSAYRRLIRDAFAPFQAWWDHAPHRAPGLRPGALPGDFAATLEVGGRRVGVVGLNTAFLQLSGESWEGRLHWDARQLHAACGAVDDWIAAHDAALLMTHHGPTWLSPAARRHGEVEIAPAGRFAAHLFGHQHTAESVYTRHGGGQAVWQVQAASVFGREHLGDGQEERRHGYTAGQIRFGPDGPTMRLWPRVATSKPRGWRYIPDFGSHQLEPDEGTAPVPVAGRRAAAQAAPPPPPAGIRSTLPGKRPFFGRTDALARIAGWLSPASRTWGVVIHGYGGVGKTALALEAAHAAPAEHYPLKLWFTAKRRDLQPEGARPRQDQRVDDFFDLLDALARALGREDVSRLPREDRPARVREALAGQRALLIFDDLESFDRPIRARVYELLDSLPEGCRALITSRRYEPSGAGHALQVDRLEREAADALLAELISRWPAALAGRAPGEADRERLYDETRGNPLLLTWVVGQLGRATGRARTVDEAVARLRAAHEHNNDPLDYIFGDLVETFTAGELAVLAALAHFSGPAEVRWLLPMTGLSLAAAGTALDGLRDRALLVEDVEAGTWWLPPLAASFLRRRRPEAVGATGERLADEVLALAMENGFDKHERFPALEQAWPRIQAALPALLAGDNGRLQAACDAIQVYLHYSGRWDVILQIGGEAEARAEAAKDRRHAGWRAFDTGFAHQLLGHVEGVLACAARAAAHWADASARERAIAIRLQGVEHRMAGDCTAATQAAEEALALSLGLDPGSEDVCVALNDLAVALKQADRLDEAEARYREALTLARALNFKEGVAMYLGNLAALALEREQWSEAERLAREALRLAEALGHQELIASDCARLADALAQQGRGAEGLPHAERAVAILTRLRSPNLAEAQDALAACRA